MNLVRFLHLGGEKEITEEMRRVGVSEEGIERLLPKASSLLVKITNVPYPLANIIKQEMLSLGGDCAVSRETVKGGEGTTSCLIMATEKQFLSLLSYLGEQPFSLAKEIASRMKEVWRNFKKQRWTIPCPRHPLIIEKRALIMGILNITPDSFYDGGRFLEVERALSRAEEMVEEGADIIDVGGESTRPGAMPVSLEEEAGRVLPVIRELAKRISVPICVDTYKAEVARRAIEEGAEMVNDISAMRFDPEMTEVVREKKVPIVLMHMKGTPKDMQDNPYYEDVMEEIYEFLQGRVEEAVKQGIDKEQIIIDPGIGFGKRLVDNLEIIRRLEEFKGLGAPILVGPSRKRFIGEILGGLPPEERLEGTLGVVAICALKGANIIRVHDIKEARRVVEVVSQLGGNS